MEKIQTGIGIPEGLKCPEDCTNKDVMCQHCVNGFYFNCNAQD